MRDDLWTDARAQELERRVLAGETYQTIAAALGVTKNAAIGKAQRLGLGAPRPKKLAALPAFPPPGRCLWPTGSAGGGYGFCGGEIAAPGAPYCPAHRARAVLRGGGVSAA